MEQFKLIEDPEEIMLNRSRKVGDYLGNPPSSILSFGPSMILVLVAIILLLGWLIKYPDVVPAELTVVTEQPAIRVYSRTSGKIRQLMVENEVLVQAGQPLALLDNTANWEHVKAYQAFLLELKAIKDPHAYGKVTLPPPLSLGTLQNSYSTLLQKLKDYDLFLGQTSASAKIGSLKSQMDHTRALNQELKLQETTLAQEVEIARKNYARNLELHKQGVISDVDQETTESHYLQYKRQLETLRTQYLTNNIRIEELQAQVIDIEQNRSDGQIDRELTLEEDINHIQSEIDEWELNFLLVAPISGKVSLSKIWSENQFVNVHEEVLTLVPVSEKGNLIGKAILPIENSGKVVPGQRVNILLDGFPYQEFGVVRATVGKISPISQESAYLVEINLPESLVTTYHKEIPFKQQMSGTANIITEDRRILERVFDRLWNLSRNS